MKVTLALMIFAVTALSAPAPDLIDTGIQALDDWCPPSLHVLEENTGQASQFIHELANACVTQTKVASNPNLWSNKVCVASALLSVQFHTSSGLVGGPGIVAGAASCKLPYLIKSLKSLSHLDRSVLASIPNNNGCEGQGGDCRLTSQNFKDLVFGAITEIGENDWPKDWKSEKIMWDSWGQVLEWTKTGNSIPYKNLDDFLHYY
ncbi:hypothetical protein C8Q74DRAFT_1221493 [Fomes fomentarius]|nr:hypothetical protein C8Q74DRAFT_1221493 [Fomes fomentarius]